ncbi:hypothetical protein, partial [Bacillus paralicheniformis]|uniref:hypothetical protein n=1 Tax=Bacillus paralicheniformis TaxID=1648923 RepID=UPI002DB80934
QSKKKEPCSQQPTTESSQNPKTTFNFGILSSFQRDPQPLQSRKAEHRKLTFTGCDDGGVQAGRLGG